MAKRDRIAQAILVGVLAAIALPIAAVITPLVFYLTAIPVGPVVALLGLGCLYLVLVTGCSLLWYFVFSHRPRYAPVAR